MEPEIRVAGPEDARAVVVLVAGFRDHLGARLPSDAELQGYVPEALRLPETEVCIARLRDADLGYALTRFSGSIWAVGLEAHLDDLFVFESSRGRSIGRSLLRFALARAKARGVRRFTLNTNERNTAAHALYRSEGLAPQAHALYPDSHEVVWVREPL